MVNGVNSASAPGFLDPCIVLWATKHHIRVTDVKNALHPLSEAPLCLCKAVPAFHEDGCLGVMPRVIKLGGSLITVPLAHFLQPQVGPPVDAALCGTPSRQSRHFTSLRE